MSGGIPVVIDTDPGIDDAIALALAVASPELDLLAVTTVGGNTGLDNTTGNALRMLHLLGRDDVPVGRGTGTPLAGGEMRPDPSIHGQLGLGGVSLAEAPRTHDERDAIALMSWAVETSPEPVTLIAIGPLTNVALFAATRPDLYARLGRLVIMGGGVRITGNQTPAAEFNIWADPEAAARVFDAGVEVTMIGLDVTSRALLAGSDWAPLRGDEAGELGRSICGMVDFYGTFYKAKTGSDATSQHDSLAVASVIDPGLVTLTRTWVGVECGGSLTRGMTVADLRDVWGHEPNAQVALDLDVDRFRDLLVGRIAELDAQLR